MFRSRVAAWRIAQHLSLSWCLALILCGSSSCSFHSGGHNHTSHCDDDHDVQDDSCFGAGATSTDDGGPISTSDSAGTSSAVLDGTVLGSALRSGRRGFAGFSPRQALQLAGIIATTHQELLHPSLRRLVLLGIVVSDERIVVHFVAEIDGPGAPWPTVSDPLAQSLPESPVRDDVQPPVPAAVSGVVPVQIQLILDRRGRLVSYTQGSSTPNSAN